MSNEQARSAVKAKIDEAAQKYLANNGTPGPGVQLLALASDGSAIYNGQFGNRGIGEGFEEPIDDKTIFWFASATKLLTAICAVKAVDLGLVGLDDDISSLVPDLADQPVRVGFGTPEATLVPRESPITIRQLLTHTAGLSYPVLERLSRPEVRQTVPFGPGALLLAERSDVIGPLNAQPGSKWEYTAASDVAGFVVEALSGLRLGEFLSKHILDPCGVKDEISFELTPAMRDRLMGSHFRWPDGRLTPRPKIYSDDVQEHLGGAGAYGTVHAYANAALPLINEGVHPLTKNKILSSSLVKEMFSPQLSPAQMEYLNSPSIANNNQVMFPGVEKQWGLGFILTPDGMHTGRGKRAGAWAGFPNTNWLVDPEKGVVFISFTQLIPQEDEKFMEFRYECERAIYGSLDV